MSMSMLSMCPCVHVHVHVHVPCACACPCSMCMSMCMHACMCMHVHACACGCTHQLHVPEAVRLDAHGHRLYTYGYSLHTYGRRPLLPEAACLEVAQLQWGTDAGLLPSGPFEWVCGSDTTYDEEVVCRPATSCVLYTLGVSHPCVGRSHMHTCMHMHMCMHMCMCTAYNCACIEAVTGHARAPGARPAVRHAERAAAPGVPRRRGRAARRAGDGAYGAGGIARRRGRGRRRHRWTDGPPRPGSLARTLTFTSRSPALTLTLTSTLTLTVSLTLTLTRWQTGSSVTAGSRTSGRWLRRAASRCAGARRCPPPGRGRGRGWD